MKIILFNPLAKSNREPATFPLGLLSIASHLKKCGHTVKLSDRTVTATDYKREINDFKPDIVGISFLSSKTVRDAKKIAEYAHALGIPVVFGNTLASAIADILLTEGFADYVCMGEGEFAFEDLLFALENERPIEDVPGFALLRDGSVFYTKPRPFADGADLPIIDWSFIEPEKYVRPSYECKRMSFVYSSKGCVANCTFCFNETFHQMNRRVRPFENVTAEIRDLIDNYGLDGIFFGDELWSASKEELYEKCKALKELNLPFVWGCHLRVGMFGQEEYDFMYECGCLWIFFGVETGSPRILKQINKGINTQKVIDAHRMAYKAGISLLPSFIIGFPGEREEDLRFTVDLIKEIAQYSNPKAFFLSPLIGTKIYYELVEKGLVEEIKKLDQMDLQWNKMKKNYSSVSDKDLKVIYSHVIWWSVTNKNSSKGKEKNKGKVGFSHPLNALLAVLISIPQNGIKMLIPNLFYSTTEFLKILFYISFFPNTKKKYGLYRNK